MNLLLETTTQAWWSNHILSRKIRKIYIQGIMDNNSLFYTITKMDISSFSVSAFKDCSLNMNYQHHSCLLLIWCHLQSKSKLQRQTWYTVTNIILIKTICSHIAFFATINLQHQYDLYSKSSTWTKSPPSLLTATTTVNTYNPCVIQHIIFHFNQIHPIHLFH